MTCSIYGCTKLAQYPFPCCNKSHGWVLKNILHALKKQDDLAAQRINPIIVKAVEHMVRDELAHRPPEEIQHYRNFINRNEPHGADNSPNQHQAAS